MWITTFAYVPDEKPKKVLPVQEKEEYVKYIQNNSELLIMLVNDFCLADRELITLTTHVLDKYGQM